MTLYRALAQLGRLITEYCEREIEKHDQAPTPIIDRMKTAWGSQQTRRGA